MGGSLFLPCLRGGAGGGGVFGCGAVLYDAVRIAITQYCQSEKEQNLVQSQNMRFKVPPPKLLT